MKSKTKTSFRFRESLRFLQDAILIVLRDQYKFLCKFMFNVSEVSVDSQCSFEVVVLRSLVVTSLLWPYCSISSWDR